MEDILILGILALLIAVGLPTGWKHFKGEGGCCGGGSTAVKRKKKKIKDPVRKKIMKIEGMTCGNCRNRVEKCINEIEGAAASVDLKKKEAVVSMDREISDDQLRRAVEQAGYQVLEIH